MIDRSRAGGRLVDRSLGRWQLVDRSRAGGRLVDRSRAGGTWLTGIGQVAGLPSGGGGLKVVGEGGRERERSEGGGGARGEGLATDRDCVMAPSRLCVPLKASGTLHNWRWSGITGHGAHVLQQAGISTPCGWPWIQQRERLSVEAWCTEVVCVCVGGGGGGSDTGGGEGDVP